MIRLGLSAYARPLAQGDIAAESADHLVIGIYGVGGGATDKIREDLEAALSNRLDRERIRDIAVFNWNDIAAHRGPHSQHLRGGSTWVVDTFVRSAYHGLRSRALILSAVATHVACAVALAVLWALIALFLSSSFTYYVTPAMFKLLGVDIPPPLLQVAEVNLDWPGRAPPRMHERFR